MHAAVRGLCHSKADHILIDDTANLISTVHAASTDFLKRFKKSKDSHLHNKIPGNHLNLHF